MTLSRAALSRLESQAENFVWNLDEQARAIRALEWLETREQAATRAEWEAWMQRREFDRLCAEAEDNRVSEVCHEQG